MLDRQRLQKELSRVESSLVIPVFDRFEQVQDAYTKMTQIQDVDQILGSKKWGILVPSWKGSWDSVSVVKSQQHPYTVFAVDGSQIYYDKHQGPACYVLNTGCVVLEYGVTQSTVVVQSDPEIIVAQAYSSAEFDVAVVNNHREHKELLKAVELAQKYATQDKPVVGLFDGTLIFNQLDLGRQQQDEQMFQEYMRCFMQLYEQKTVHVGYVSFPRGKELVSVLRLVSAEFDEKRLHETDDWLHIYDMDIAAMMLEQGTRSIVFQSKAPVTYAYPSVLKPYFCYMHVGKEIVRLEFPAWIAQQPELVDTLCAVAYDQAQKGNGYPVALFEAHQQAVITSVDREYFYQSLRSSHMKRNTLYATSIKSFKKRNLNI